MKIIKTLCENCKQALEKLDQVKLRTKEGLIYDDFLEACNEEDHLAVRLTMNR